MGQYNPRRNYSSPVGQNLESILSNWTDGSLVKIAQFEGYIGRGTFRLARLEIHEAS
jgi:hypothetical protein